ncbi:MAG: UDP-N-acetylglucosamine 2-epimerase (non-hydrolyzing) [Acidobacteria bacterium]|nr:UDP-N-acetylglucosamine 2-epimerase (non-hydrolyzing) [Acidobacteriota bacterium]
MKKKIILVAGARPNFMKIAPIMEELQKHGDSFAPLLVHTGQHYDDKMSTVFFDDLEIPRPDINLEVGSGSHADQTAAVMIRFEEVCLKEKPDLVMVVGDVNSTLACSLVAAKLHIPVAHVEAGLRSRNRRMPEEINRVLTDQISDFLFTTSEDAGANLLREGIAADKIHFVGNVMIDTLLKNVARAEASTVLDDLGLTPRTYAVLTLHRPSNVDDRDELIHLFSIFKEVQDRIPLIYPTHPRTLKTIAAFGMDEMLTVMPDFVFCDPLGYLDFLQLMKNAKLVLTDSGGIQEETTVLGVPCLTLRNETERPVTITHGTNILVKKDRSKILAAVDAILAGLPVPDARPPLWDGLTAQRIVSIILGSGLDILH